MRKTFDRRVVSSTILDFVRACQARVPCHLAGGAALAGAYLGHRLTGDVDLFVADGEAMRDLVRLLDDAAAEAGVTVDVRRDVGYLVRARIESADGPIDLDVVHDPVADIESPPPPLEGVVVKSLVDLRASKLTCILSRSEPRDLVDLYFLDRAGYAPEQDLDLALRKDGGIDPGMLAWLLSQFPIAPLPDMLEPLSPEALREFRDRLAERMRNAVASEADDRRE